MTRPSHEAHDEAGMARFGLSFAILPPVLLLVFTASLLAQAKPCPAEATLPNTLAEWHVILPGVGAVIALLEQISGLLMLGWTFRIAIPVKGALFSRSSTALPQARFETNNVKARQAGPNEWLFRHKMRVFEFQTPLQIRGVARVEGNRLVLEGRQEWGALLFFAGFAVGAAPILGPVVAISMVGFSIVFQRVRFWDDCREVAQKCGAVVA